MKSDKTCFDDEEEKRKNKKSADAKYLFGFWVKMPGSFLKC